MAANPLQDHHREPKMTVLRQLVGVRFADGWALLATDRPQRRAGAVYLGGYGVECALKARICADRGEDRLDKRFFTHDLRTLAQATDKWKELQSSPERYSTLVYLITEWEVEMRYAGKTLDAADVRTFLKRANDFTQWLLGN